MSDPKLKACSVVVRYEADDGYNQTAKRAATRKG